MTGAGRTIVVGDVGGTHARFALATLTPDAPPVIGPVRKYRTAEHDGLTEAWSAFVGDSAIAPPDAAAIAVAAPIEGEVLRFTNSHWTIDRRTIAASLGLEQLLLLNDFGAVAHAVSALPTSAFEPLLGSARKLPDDGAITVVGLGTGLGVALTVRRNGASEILECEGGHIGFAPRNAIERQIEQAMTARHGRCSVERIASGPGLADIHAVLGGTAADAAALWTAALGGSDPIAVGALDVLTEALGAAAGDLCLAHGSSAVVLSGGLANRMRERLASPSFREAFAAKGRYRERMERVALLLLTEPEPGLIGAAVAFQRGSSQPVTARRGTGANDAT